MKYVFALILLTGWLNIEAQQKKYFFDNLYFSGMAGNQVYDVTPEQWKNLFANRSNFPYPPDSLKSDFIPKDGPLWRLNVKSGLSLAAGKSLLKGNKGWMRNKVLEWRTALHYKTAAHEPASSLATSTNYPTDTTKVHTITNVRLEQKKQILEWEQLVNFKTAPFLLNKLRMNIGSGFSISRTVASSIHEKYYQTTYTWNSSLRYFVTQSTPFTEADFKAKPETLLSYVFYLGTELKLASHMSLLSDFRYSIAHYKNNELSPKIESYWLGLTFRYGLNQ
ncbi:MAG: hypothetical protein U0V75_03190 [Ferruginibacter sp.]